MRAPPTRLQTGQTEWLAQKGSIPGWTPGPGSGPLLGPSYHQGNSSGGEDFRWTSAPVTALLPRHGLRAGPTLRPRGRLCSRGRDTSQSVPRPSASSGKGPRGGYSDSRGVPPAPTSGRFSRPPGSPPNPVKPSLEPKRNEPTAQKLKEKAERRRGVRPHSGPAWLVLASRRPRHADVRTARPQGWGSRRPSALALAAFSLGKASLSHVDVSATKPSQGCL